MIYIHNINLCTHREWIEQAAVLINAGQIESVGRENEVSCPQGAQSIDGGGLTLVPGFIDLQVNGAFGVDFTSNPEGIWKAGEHLIQYGVTSFLPTIISSPPETIRQAQAVILKGPPDGYRGAKVIGLHLEGPFLNPIKAGAHNPRFIFLPDPNLYKDWSPGKGVRMVTLAPEQPGALEAIRTLTQNGVLVGAGHSMADLNHALAGFSAGVRYGTHLFNAMTPLDHHQPGLTGAILHDPRITAGLIVDGVHLHPDLVDTIWKVKGPTLINLVTDGMAAFGMPVGEYKLGEHSIKADRHSARLANGKLAGSLLSMDQALHNLITFTGCRLEDAIATLTQVPSHLLGLGESLGCILPGFNADLVLLTHELKVARTWVDGQEVQLN